jgi:hypothetical protein
MKEAGVKEEMEERNQEEDKIIFVYNADSGLFHMATDYFQKMVSPGTYSCHLCAITFGSLGMKREWKTFIANLDMPAEFLHRDEFLELYPSMDVKFPAAFVKRGSDISLLIPHTEINKAKSVEDLMKLVTEKIADKQVKHKQSNTD